MFLLRTTGNHPQSVSGEKRTACQIIAAMAHLSKKLDFGHFGKLRRYVYLVSMILLLAGCATNLLHNAADFKTASEADEIQKKIDYSAIIQEERGVQEKILKHEISVVDKFAKARRNFALLNLMTLNENLSDSLRKRIIERQGRLGGELKPWSFKIDFLDLLPQDQQHNICGQNIRSIQEIYKKEKDADEEPSPYSYADPAELAGQLHILFTTCSAKLSRTASDYYGKLGFEAPVCPPDGILQDYNNLKKSTINTWFDNYKAAHPTTDRSEDQIREEIGESYSDYRGVCSMVRAHEAAGRMLVEGCSGNQCAPRDPEVTSERKISGRHDESSIGTDSKISGLAESSLWRKNWERLNAARSDVLKDQVATAKAKKDYTDAQEAYKRAAEKAKPQDNSEVAGKGLRGALQKLTEAGDLGKLFLVKEQVAKIDEVLKAAATGEYDKDAIKTACATDSTEKDKKNCGLAQAAAVVTHLPVFADRIDHISTLADAPFLSGLLLEKSRLLALQQQADKNIQRRQREIAILEMDMEMIDDEMELLQEANKSLDQVKKFTKTKSKQGGMTSDEFSNPKTDAEAKEFMLLALGKYLRTFTGPRRHLHANEYRLIALEHEATLDYSEASLNIWKSSIEIPVSALLAYHEGGLTPKDIIELLKALGLAGIAVGVF
jgi:hypothetical protein